MAPIYQTTVFLGYECGSLYKKTNSVIPEWMSAKLTIGDKWGNDDAAGCVKSWDRASGPRIWIGTAFDLIVAIKRESALT